MPENLGPVTHKSCNRVKRATSNADAALQTELSMLERLLGSPHVINVLDAFMDNQYRYIVLELCFGLDLVDSLIEELRFGVYSHVNDTCSHNSTSAVRLMGRCWRCTQTCLT